MTNWRDNNDIQNVSQLDNGWIKIEYKKGKGESIEIPEYVSDKKVPLIDPFSKTTGWFRVQNTIFDSCLTNYAKLCFCALRRAVIHGVGFTVVNIQPTEKENRCLMNFMSVKTHNTVDKALNELEYFGIIKIGNYIWRKIPKKIYIFVPESEWRLPNDEQAAQYQQKLNQDRANKKQKRKQENIEEEKQATGEFVFTTGGHKGKTMQEVYDESPDDVINYAQTGSTDELKQAAQMVIDENEIIPF